MFRESFLFMFCIHLQNYCIMSQSTTAPKLQARNKPQVLLSIWMLPDKQLQIRFLLLSKLSEGSHENHLLSSSDGPVLTLIVTRIVTVAKKKSGWSWHFNNYVSTNHVQIHRDRYTAACTSTSTEWSKLNPILAHYLKSTVGAYRADKP